MTATQLEIDSKAHKKTFHPRSTVSHAGSFKSEKLTQEQEMRAKLKNGLTYYEVCEIENTFQSQKPLRSSTVKRKDGKMDQFVPYVD